VTRLPPTWRVVIGRWGVARMPDSAWVRRCRLAVNMRYSAMTTSLPESRSGRRRSWSTSDSTMTMSNGSNPQLPTMPGLKRRFRHASTVSGPTAAIQFRSTNPPSSTMQGSAAAPLGSDNVHRTPAHCTSPRVAKPLTKLACGTSKLMMLADLWEASAVNMLCCRQNTNPQASPVRRSITRRRSARPGVQCPMWW